MSTALAAINTLLQHDKQEFDTWVNQVLNFNTETLKKAIGTIEYLCEDTFLDIQEKLLDYSQTLESSYEDGEVLFPSGHWNTVEFWGVTRLEQEPSYEEEQFLNNISKIKEACL